jgi:competence protein ComEA
MFAKIILSLSVLATTMLFGMSVEQLNSASKAELMAIKGIGEKKADEIIKERQTRKFVSIQDLSRVKGIGDSIVANVKNDVKTVNNKKKTKKTAS